VWPLQSSCRLLTAGTVRFVIETLRLRLGKLQLRLLGYCDIKYLNKAVIKHASCKEILNIDMSSYISYTGGASVMTPYLTSAC